MSIYCSNSGVNPNGEGYGLLETKILALVQKWNESKGSDAGTRKQRANELWAGPLLVFGAVFTF